MAHVAKWKKNTVQYLSDVLVDCPVIGIVDVGGIPASQLQQIRRSLPSGSRLIIIKNTLLRLALKKASAKKENIEKLIESLDGQRGVITADINPFRLFRTIESTKIKAPAKGGETAPDDIVIKEGETSFKPGPVVGELQKAGFPAAIERGKVVIRKDKTMVKKGQRIPTDVAKMLTKLEIYPMTVGLSLLVSYEDGAVFAREVLDVDVDGYIRSIEGASKQAFNLAIFVDYPTEMTILPLLQNAHQNAFNLALNAEIPTNDTMMLLISKAQIQAQSLASRMPDLMAGGSKDEEKKKEEASPEAKPSSEE